MLDAAFERILAFDMPGFARMWAPDGVLEFPFASASGPARLQGREAVVDYLSVYNDLMLPRTLRNVIRHETTDPDTIVIEFEVEGEIVATHEDFKLGYVWIVTVGDDGFTRIRDYWSPLHAEQIIGSANLKEAAKK